ncbi:MAG: putative esterase [Cyclobacteriaceae bacterium]|jgi:predicted esterase
MQHHLDISYKASYTTLNELTTSTKHIWIVCHGYGQLAEHFVKRFDVFDPKEHFIVAPQGLSKFYIERFRKVGASWMTKEDREADLENQRSYFHQVFNHLFSDINLEDYKVHLLGFSQGGSTICRLAVYQRVVFDTLILWAGAFPSELIKENFDFIKSSALLKVVIGNQDEYYDPRKFQKEIDKAEQATGLTHELIRFEGKHVIDRGVLRNVL